MCNPMFVALIGVAVAAAGQAQQAHTANAIAEHNQDVADIAAKADATAAANEMQAQASKTEQFMGQQRAAAAASGADAGSQSFNKDLQQSAQMGALDLATTEHNTMMKVWADKNQATAYNLEGSAAKQMGMYSSFGTAITGMGRAWEMKNRSEGKGATNV